MKLKIALSVALLATSFASHAELKMSINEQTNSVVVTVYKDGERVPNAQVTTNIRGQQETKNIKQRASLFLQGKYPESVPI